MLKLSIKLFPERPSEQFAQFEKWYPGRLQAAHMGAVLGILERYASWSRVDTGRFRGGWTGPAKMVNYPIQRSMTIIAGSNAEAEGMAASSVTNSYLSTFVLNGVQYGGFLEEQSGIFDPYGKSSFHPSPYKGLMDSLFSMQLLYSQMMEKVLGEMDANLSKKDFPDETFVDFGMPPPSGGIE